jgi:hypothetical protein
LFVSGNNVHDRYNAAALLQARQLSSGLSGVAEAEQCWAQRQAAAAQALVGAAGRDSMHAYQLARWAAGRLTLQLLASTQA